MARAERLAAERVATHNAAAGHAPRVQVASTGPLASRTVHCKDGVSLCHGNARLDLCDLVTHRLLQEVHRDRPC